MQWVPRRRRGLLISRQGLFRLPPLHRVVAERPQAEWRLLLLPLGVVADRPQMVADRPQMQFRRSQLEFRFSTRVAERSQRRSTDQP